MYDKYGKVTHPDLVTIRNLVVNEPVAFLKWSQVVDTILNPGDAVTVKRALGGDVGEAVLNSLIRWHGYGRGRADLIKELRKLDMNLLAGKIEKVVKETRIKRLGVQMMGKPPAPGPSQWDPEQGTIPNSSKTLKDQDSDEKFCIRLGYLLCFLSTVSGLFVLVVSAMLLHEYRGALSACKKWEVVTSEGCKEEKMHVASGALGIVGALIQSMAGVVYLLYTCGFLARVSVVKSLSDGRVWACLHSIVFVFVLIPFIMMLSIGGFDLRISSPPGYETSTTTNLEDKIPPPPYRYSGVMPQLFITGTGVDSGLLLLAVFIVGIHGPRT